MNLLPSQIDAARLERDLAELAAFSSVPAPAVTRVLFSEEDLAARAFIKQLCAELDLTVREDAVGNLFARWVGTSPELPALATGSHIDAIPNAGRYDGVMGVLGVLAAFRALRLAGFVPRRSLELILFTAEEPTRFGLGCLGSRLLSGQLLIPRALELKDRDGKTLADWLKEMPFGHAPLAEIPLAKDAYAGFVELHIEQGKILEERGLDLGLVQKIAGPSAFRFHLEGEGGHAGAVLMPGRRDALLAGCELALAIEQAALHSGSEDTVATTGVFTIKPGAINSIPHTAYLEVDLRDTDSEARARAIASIRRDAEEIATRRKIGLREEPISLDPPALCDAGLVDAVERVAQAAGYSTLRMISRAYHDSLFMAQVCPTTMIFIPCRGGVSHRPDEFSTTEQMARGVHTLAQVLAELSLA